MFDRCFVGVRRLRFFLFLIVLFRSVSRFVLLVLVWLVVSIRYFESFVLSCRGSEESVGFGMVGEWVGIGGVGYNGF